MFSVLLYSCLHAVKSRSATIGTDDLLGGLFAQAPRLRAAFDTRPPASPAGWRSRQRPLLVPTASTCVEWEALGVLREVHWRVTVDWRPAPAGVGEPVWEDEVRCAVEEALRSAAERGRWWAGLDDLFHALMADPYNRANDVVRHHLTGPVVGGVTEWVWPGGDTQRPIMMVDRLAQMGILADLGSDTRTTRTGRLVARLVPLVTQASPVLVELENQAAIQAIRLAHERVTTAHLMLAVLAFEHQQGITGLSPRAGTGRTNQPLLAELGATYPQAVGRAAAIEPAGDLAPPRRRRAIRTRPGYPRWTAAAARAADHARQLAVGGGIPAGSLHLIHAALGESDGAAARLLSALSVDPEQVLARTRSQLMIE
jgi:hypothetical protein